MSVVGLRTVVGCNRVATSPEKYTDAVDFDRHRKRVEYYQRGAIAPKLNAAIDFNR